MKRRGFTLFEVLVTIGLIAVLVAAMTAFLHDALRIRSRVSEELGRSVTAEAAIAELESALETCVVDDPALGTGVLGDSTRIDVLRAGLSTWRLGGTDPRRAFESVERVRVEFRDAQRRVAIARGESEATELPGELFRLRFRYFDGTEWTDRFDSGERGGLPTAVEVSVWFVEPHETNASVARPETDESEVEPAPLTPPDRRRVIVIPDATPEPAR